MALAIVTALLVFVALFGYPGVFGSGANREGLRVEGHAVARWYDASGNLLGEWSGQNSLSGIAISAIAACLGGISTTPFAFKTCTDLTTGIEAIWNCAAGVNCPSTPTVLSDSASELVQCNQFLSCKAVSLGNTGIQPSGCNPTTTEGCATGWNVTANFGSTTFTGVDCGSSCIVSNIEAGLVTFSQPVITLPPIVSGISSFDLLTPSIPVSPGDTLVLAITFTVS